MFEAFKHSNQFSNDVFFISQFSLYFPVSQLRTRMCVHKRRTTTAANFAVMMHCNTYYAGRPRFALQSAAYAHTHTHPYTHTHTT